MTIDLLSLSNDKFDKSGGTISGNISIDGNITISTGNTIVASGAGLTSLNAAELTTGTVSISRLPIATDTGPGIVQMNDTVTSTSTTQASTANIARSLYDSVQTLRSTTVSSGSGLTGGGSLESNRIISHADTSTQPSVDNVNGTVIQDITLDGFGHVTGLGSVNLDSRYYTESESDSRFVNVSGDTMSGSLSATAFTGDGSGLTNLSGSEIATGTVDVARLPDASTSAQGVVQLSSATNSTSTTLAATASAVKSAYDLADGKVSKSGDTMTGNLSFGSVDRQMINLWNTSFGIGVQNYTTYFRTGGNFGWYTGGSHVDNTILDPGTGGTVMMALTGTGLGLGSASPSQKLHIEGNSYVSGTSFIGSTTRGLRGVTGDYGTVQTTGEAAGGWEGYSIEGRYVLMSADDNRVGLYNDLDNEWMIYCYRNSYCKLYFNGAEKLATENGGVKVTGYLNATGDVTAYSSDRRLKTRIRPIDGILDKVKRLGGYTFTWKDVDGLPMQGDDVGLIAQDLENIGLGDLLLAHAPFDRGENGESMSGEWYKTIHFNKLHGVWAQALKELSHIVDDQRDTIRNLREMIDALENRIQQVEKRYNAM